ncbi:MAG: N-acetyltransferase [Reinekea sp.]
MSLEIRRASAADLDAIDQVEQQSFSGEKFSRRQLRYLLTQAQAATWLAFSEELAVGYCIGLLPHISRPARLYSLAVLPVGRGQGIGSALIQQFIDTAMTRGYQRARLEVSEKNTIARRLYEQQGFADIKTLPDYYQPGEHGLRMQRFLAC